MQVGPVGGFALRARLVAELLDDNRIKGVRRTLLEEGARAIHDVHADEAEGIRLAAFVT